MFLFLLGPYIPLSCMSMSLWCLTEKYILHYFIQYCVTRWNLRHSYFDLIQGLHYSFQTRDKLYFVLDYVNGGEVGLKGIKVELGKQKNESKMN